MTTHIVIKSDKGILVDKFSLLDKADFLLDLTVSKTTEEERLDKDFPIFCITLGNIYKPTILALINEKHIKLDQLDVQNINKIKKSISKYPTLKNILDVKYIENYELTKEDFGGKEFKFIKSSGYVELGFRECPKDIHIDDFFGMFYCINKY